MGNIFSYNSPLWNMVNKLLHFIWLSFLWLVCCIPVVTVGASTTALYAVCQKYAKDQDGYLTASFFRAFRQNFRQSTVIWLLFLAVGCILGVDFVAYYRSADGGVFQLLQLTVFVSVLVAYSLSGFFVFALQAQFDNSVKKTVLNSVLMAVKHWPSSLVMIFAMTVILMLGVLAFPPILFCAPALICYINSRIMGKVFDGYVVS